MKIVKLPFSQIRYETCAYEPSLKDSIERMGLGFPIHVRQIDEQLYQCVDGHKRLSVIHTLLAEGNHKQELVKAIVLNSARTPSGTAKNHH